MTGAKGKRGEKMENPVAVTEYSRKGRHGGAGAQEDIRYQVAALRAINKKTEKADSVTSSPASSKTAKVILNDTDAVICDGDALFLILKPDAPRTSGPICAGRTARSLKSTAVRQAMRRACVSLGGRAFETAERA